MSKEIKVTTADNNDVPGVGGKEFIVNLDSRWSNSSNPIDLKKEIYDNLPRIIKSTLLTSEGWLVGSSPWKLIIGELPKDYDIIVEDYEKYMVTVAQLAQVAYKMSINTFGGLKFNVENLEIDIWPENLGHFIKTASTFKYAYNLKRHKLIKNGD